MKKINYIQIALALFMTLFLSQCYYDQIVYEDPVPDGEEVSFMDDIIPIFNADCNSSGCHNTGGIPPDLTPDNAYDALINGEYIDTEDPENSELYQWMIGARSIPMPISGPDRAYNSTVLQWITEGANNN